MSLNENLFKAIAGTAKQVAIDNHLPAIVEHLDVRTADYMQAPLRVEIHVSGPYTRPVGRDVEVKATVQVMLLSRYDASPLAIVAQSDNFADRLRRPIFVTDYDCLYSDGVEVTHSGQLTPTDQVKRTTIASVYRGVINGE